MVIFKQTQGPVGGVMSGGKGPVIPFPSQDSEVCRIKVITYLIKIVINLNKAREEAKNRSGDYILFYLKILKVK